MTPLTFGELRKANVRRCEQVFHHLNDWSPSDWSNAMAGEVGEACNLTKKLRRGDKVNIAFLEEEIADVIIYADLLAARLGINLDMAVRRKFNEVSDRRNSNIFL